MLRSLLLIDDEPDTIRPLQIYLRAKGYEAVSVPSIDAGREQLAQRPFDVILLDLVTPPNWNPADNLKFVDELKKNSLVFAVSGIAVPSTIADCYRAGVGFIPKPCDPQDVLNKVLTEWERRYPSAEVAKVLIDNHAEKISEQDKAAISEGTNVKLSLPKFLSIIAAVFLMGGACYSKLGGIEKRMEAIEANQIGSLTPLKFENWTLKLKIKNSYLDMPDFDSREKP